MVKKLKWQRRYDSYAAQTETGWYIIDRCIGGGAWAASFRWDRIGKREYISAHQNRFAGSLKECKAACVAHFEAASPTTI